MGAALQRAWLRRGALAALLLPLSWLFGGVAAIRRFAYRSGWLSTTRVDVPVLVVGNVVAGGSGKTPVVMAVVQHLQSRGIRCGVVSRGYGRESHDCREVQLDSMARDVGDEPLLVARTCDCPVFVALRRAEAAHALLAAHPCVQIIVSDDGLQHYALERDIELCVFDDRGVGNGWLLPAGPLRQPWPRSVNLVVRSPGARGIEGHVVDRALASFALASDGALRPLEELRAQPIVAVAGIARPDAFFDMLRARGLVLTRTFALPDHATFDDALSSLPANATLLCTQKDAVKLWALRPDALAVPLQVTFAQSFWLALDSLVDAKLSSAHGPQTA